MSDPQNPNPSRIVKNPPKEARRRAPRAPEPEAPPPEGQEAEEEKKGPPPRGMVCHACGKYFDITGQRIGSTFECKCGATLTVPPPLPREGRVTRPPEVTLRLVELRRTSNIAMISMIVAFVVCIALASACIYVLANARYVTAVIAGFAALIFLIVGVIAANEMRRARAEIAAEEAGSPE